MIAEYRRVMNELNDAFQDYYTVYNKGAKQIDDYQLTVQQENTMLFIMRNERTTAHEIASAFSISKSAVSQVLSKLEAGHFIIRESNPDNLRESFILLGEEGTKYAELINKADETIVQKFSAHIKLEELEQMLRTVKKINRVITGSEEEQ
ncbi:MarR family transcriptional regulator [Paenibacillus sp. E194]|uniref:MarR family winged helix-turn-helix transcriptional regulator n=1 Tax=Paenibacillus sp. E194 TaxID=1458845 RepID=UPI0005C9DBD4|nr:MarR family transcriptional regulator [Paenibacillus sp. E194]KJB88147.1 MarR family transcriptional regulator [Paenibacillus sp. E194]